uniref:Uncharacterized protein n=2 Tax=Eutreptiella gymnastica TaxID=73025 RepID=A0A7S1IUG8_9EUGL
MSCESLLFRASSTTEESASRRTNSSEAERTDRREEQLLFGRLQNDDAEYAGEDGPNESSVVLGRLIRPLIQLDVTSRSTKLVDRMAMRSTAVVQLHNTSRSTELN